MTAPTTTATLMLCLLLGSFSAACCFWLLQGSFAAGLWVQYAPGAILGACALLAGQAALGAPHLPVTRAASLLLASVLAWRLALHLRLAGAPLPWISASLVGSLGIGVGAVLAWPERTAPKQLLIGLALTGIASGGLFAMASMLQLIRRDSPWSLGLLCIWHIAVLSLIAVCLRRGVR